MYHLLALPHRSGRSCTARTAPFPARPCLATRSGRGGIARSWGRRGTRRSRGTRRRGRSRGTAKEDQLGFCLRKIVGKL